MPFAGSIEHVPLEELRWGAPPAPEPTFMRSLKAAFRQDNIVGSILASENLAVPRSDAFHHIDRSYNVFNDIEGYEHHAKRFTHVFNAKAAQVMKTQIDMEEKDRRVLEASGFVRALLTRGTAMILDPTLFIPGGAIMKGERLGQAALKSALRVGAGTGAIEAAHEAGLHATQELRTGETSLLNIGGAAILGALLGGGASAVMTMAERRQMAKVLKEAIKEGFDAEAQALHDEIHHVSSPQSLGAAVAPKATLEDFSIAGNAASKVAKATAQMNPLLRTLQSPSVLVRDIASQMMETPIYLKKNMHGFGDMAAETAMHEYTRGRLAQVLQKQKDLWLETRKAGDILTQKEFNEAVGRALRRLDASEIPGVEEAAKVWRKQIFDPLKERAIKARLLPEDVHVSTAASYFSRMWSRPALEANETKFRKIVKDWLSDEIAVAERKEEARLAKGETQEQTFNFVSDEDRDNYIDTIISDIWAKLTGRDHAQAFESPFVVSKRGPLKERTFHIPDYLVEEFLEHDVELVGRRYARIMAGDIELAQRFGSADMRNTLKNVVRDYEEMRQKIYTDATLTEALKAKSVKALNKRERADIRDLTAVRDILRGQYRPEIQHTTAARLHNAAGSFNYMRALGGMLISSLSDVVRPAMVHGLSAYMRDGLIPLIRRVKAVKMSVEEAKMAGAISEKILASRMATLAEITDPYAVGSPFEHFLRNAASGFTRMTGILHWNDFQKSLSATMTQNRILRNAEAAATKGFDALSPSEKAYMGFLGLGHGRAEYLGKMFKSHGETEGGILVANTQKWGSDEIADIIRRAYRGAINKDVDSIIVTKGVGDVPLFMNTPTGRLIGQFKSFALASNQRVLMRGLQEDKTRFIGGILGMTVIGAFTYALKQMESGREVSDNPGTWVAEGLDRSGIFSVAFEINNVLEKFGYLGLYQAMAAPFRDKEQRTSASRYAVRSNVGSLLGPGFGGVSDMATLLGLPWREMGASDIEAMRRLTPFASLPYFRWFIDGMVMPELKDRIK
ncbi:MAG: hypothetical protein JSC189_001036 [Candidatus Tokpelaia sp. JSC189]|nr:MAG: hypothetical protein JSC189_001036 [Candidatus Tokpelaia sp. JSC189]